VRAFAQRDELEQLRALVFASLGPCEPLMQRQHFVRVHPAGEAEELREVTDLPPRLERARANAANLCQAGARAHEPAGDLDERGLPRSIRSQ
jgi:hypothetical protein